MRWSIFGFVVYLVFLVLPFACTSTGSSGNDGGGREIQVEVRGERSPQSFDLSERLEEGVARVGVIRDAKELVGGANSLEKIGDIKIYNSKVAFVIAGKRSVNGYLPFGGKIVAADIVRAKGEAGRSLWGEFSLAFEHRMMKPEKIEIVNDGSDGRDAVVRFSGPDHSLELLQSYIKAVVPSLVEGGGELGFWITNEFRLAPNSEKIELKVTLENRSKDEVNVRFSEIGMFMGDGLLNYFPGKGFIDTKVTGVWPYHGLAGKDVGYVLFPKPGTAFQVLIKYKTVLIGLHDPFTLYAGDKKEYSWYIAVGRDLAAAQAVYQGSLPGAHRGLVQGKVLDEIDKKPVSGAEIHIEQKTKEGDAYIGQSTSLADGSFSIKLPIGFYSLRVVRSGMMGPKVQMTVAAGGGGTISLLAPTVGNLLVEASDGDGAGRLPVKVSVFPLQKMENAIPEHFGSSGRAGGAVALLFPHDGKVSHSLPPGKYKVVVSRGFFYNIHEEEVEIKANQEVLVKATMRRAVQIPGTISGDFHIHAKGSTDSDDTDALKVSAMAGEGLQLAVSTDHEYLTDFQPTIDKLKLTSRIRAVVGEEVTTHYGHFNAYPLPFQPGQPNNGVVPWHGKLAPETFDLVYKVAPEAILQINHPRGIPAGSYFSYVGYDREKGTATLRPKEWSTRFNAIEVINGKRFGGSITEEMYDWFDMLNRGRRVTGMGNSDSHKVLTSEVGYPRNMITVAETNPQKVTMASIAKSIKEGRVVVSGGAMIFLKASASADGSKAVSLGDTLSLSDGKVYLDIRVEAAPWVELEQIEVIANGKSILKEALTIKDGARVRFEKTLSFSPTEDTWYSVMVFGKKKLFPVVPTGTPFAFTNPIFVDADKDGKFTAIFAKKP